MTNYILVTVTYNDVDNLKRTLKSVRNNKLAFHKYYIIDGNSKDSTIELINDYKDVIDDFITESDFGIYDAMNKVGRFQINKNDFILWLNAGDELLDWSSIDLRELQNFNCAFFSVLAKTTFNSLGFIKSPSIYFPQNERNFYPKSKYQHQGFLVRYSLFNQLYYDTTIGIQAENLLMAKCIIENHFFVSNKTLSVYYLDGISNTNTFSVLVSYLRVAKKLNFSLIKLVYYQKFHFAKLLIRGLMPSSLVIKLIEYKNHTKTLL